MQGFPVGQVNVKDRHNLYPTVSQNKWNNPFLSCPKTDKFYHTHKRDFDSKNLSDDQIRQI